MLPLIQAGVRAATPYVVRGLAHAMKPPTVGETAAGTAANIVLKQAGVDLPPITPKGGLEEGLAAAIMYNPVYREGDPDMGAAVDTVRASNNTIAPVVEKHAKIVPLKSDGTVSFKSAIEQHKDYLTNN